MTIAWYGHLKFKLVPLVTVVLVSWGIAFVEYCFAVPANRIGSAVYSPAELETIQEVITLIVYRGLFQGAAEPHTERGLRLDRTWCRFGVPRTSLTGKSPKKVRSLRMGCTNRPEAVMRLNASEQIAYRQD